MASSGRRSPCERIRDRTRSEHDRSERVVEERFFGSDGIDREDYEDLLWTMLGLHRPLDRRLLRAARRHLTTFRYRPRAPRLENDLRVLGVDEDALAEPPVARPETLPSLQTVPEVLGCLYVVEGAELGGRVIWKRLTGSLAPSALAADAFYGTDAREIRERWNRFRRVFNRRIQPGPALEDTVVAASATFRFYRRWMTS